MTATVTLALIRAARESALNYRRSPTVGALVVEVTALCCPESIGYLVAHGEAPLNADGTGPMREVWDVRPVGEERSMRWENAEFLPLPPRFEELVEALILGGST